MILVDASVWINDFNGISSWQTDLLDSHLSNDPIFIGDLILTEVLQGFTSDKDFQTAKNLVSGLPFCLFNQAILGLLPHTLAYTISEFSP